MEQLLLANKPKFDRFGREILDKKITLYFREDEIILHGAVKKKVIDYEYDEASGTKKVKSTKEEFQALDIDEVPFGWHKRHEYKFFYKPNLQSLINIFNEKNRNPIISFAPSFCIYANRKFKEAEEISSALDKIRNLSLDDEEKIKSLPDISPKRVPDMLHQKIAHYYGYYLPECGLLEEQGLGKTKTAIETFVAKHEGYRFNSISNRFVQDSSYSKVDRCLIVGPLSVINKNGWIKQIEEYAPDDYHSIIIRGTKEEKIAILDGDKGEYDFYLINYEGLLNIQDEILSWVDDRTMVILDESSKIKNFYANRSKICIEIGKLTRHKMILTGTPVTQNAYDIFSQFDFLDCGDTLGESYNRFIDMHFVSKGYKKTLKYGASERIHNKIFNKCVRFTKDVIKDLPEKTYQVREVEMQPLQRKYYKAILQQEMIRLSELEKVDAQNILVTILRLQQITSCFVSPKDSNDVKQAPKPIECVNPKLSELEDLIDELGGKQVVVWTRFRYDIEVISKMLEKNNITYIKYVGGMNEIEREKSEKAFLDGKAQVFLSIPSAGGYGMNLQCASQMIYYSNDYSLQNRLQSEDREHRMGQKSNVNIIDIICVDNESSVPIIDEQVLKVLRAKKNIADQVTGDEWKQFLGI